MAEEDEAALARIVSACGDPRHDGLTPARLAKQELAARWGADGLHVDGVAPDEIVAHVGPPMPAMTTLLFRRGAQARWRLCAVIPGA
jgi:hypothetical protein